MDAEPLVERDPHRGGAPLPLLDLGVVEVEPTRDLLELLGRGGLDLAYGGDGLFQVVASHHVGEQVVVHHRRVLVGPGHTVDVERLLPAQRRLPQEAEVDPHPRGLDEHVDARGS